MLDYKSLQEQNEYLTKEVQRTQEKFNKIRVAYHEEKLKNRQKYQLTTRVYTKKEVISIAIATNNRFKRIRLKEPIQDSEVEKWIIDYLRILNQPNNLEHEIKTNH